MNDKHTLDAEIMQNSRDDVSSGQDLEVTKVFIKLKISQLFESLNDAAVKSMPMFATLKVETERVILRLRNRELTFGGDFRC